MKRVIIVLLCVLVACAPVEEPEVVEQPRPAETGKADVPPPVTREVESPTRTVRQSGVRGSVVYGLTEDDRLVRVEKPGGVWEVAYDEGRVRTLSGPQEVSFSYDQERLSAIDAGETKLQFSYDSSGNVKEVAGGRETLHADYDANGHLREVRRGVAGATRMDYDDAGNIATITRGQLPMALSYDDRDRLRKIDTGNSHLILGFWRDDKLSSLSGNLFGQGLSLSYGPDYPPFEAELVHEEDASVFSSAYTSTLYAVVDEYVYCKYVRRYDNVLFDGVTFAVFRNYVGGDLSEYIEMQYRCVMYEA